MTLLRVLGGGGGLTVVTYSGSLDAARPTATVVVWEGFPGQPTNMANGDVWLDTATDGKLLSGSGAPTSGDGANGDFWIRTSNSTLYGPKAAGSWPAGVSLVGATGAKGDTGAPGSGMTLGAWQTISLGSSLAAISGYYTPGYRLEGTDIVRFRGTVTTSGTITANSSFTSRTGTVLFNLPVGFRPSAVVALDATSNNAATFKLVIDTNGDVTPAGAPASGSNLTLDGLAFTL